MFLSLIESFLKYTNTSANFFFFFDLETMIGHLPNQHLCPRINPEISRKTEQGYDHWDRRPGQAMCLQTIAPNLSLVFKTQLLGRKKFTTLIYSKFL